MLLITYTAVGILVLNAMLMNVFERIRELGVMKALGISPLRVFFLIFSEALLQVTAAALLALAAGLPLAYFFQSNPIDLSMLAGTSATIAGVAIEPYWFCKVTAEGIALPIVFLYLITACAILYPACKAALIRPIKAIYHR